MGLRRRTHGQTIGSVRTGGSRASPIYRVWQAMKDRCLNANCSQYKNYGGRGITVCDRWRTSFETFEADVGPRPDGAELDRIDNEGNYEPGNVRWTTRIVNQNNKRTNHRITFGGETMTLAEWARRLGGSTNGLVLRLRSGMPEEQALTLPFGDPYETRRRAGRWGGGEIMFIERNGERLTPHQWAKRTGIEATTIRDRILRGWTPERALTTPPRPTGQRKADSVAA